VGDGLFERNFVFAEVLLKNTCCSRVVDANKRQTLLYLLVAHITSLFDTNPTPAPVGVLTDATEGSVSAGFNFGTITPNEAWYAQTQYGAMFWAMTAAFPHVHLRSRAAHVRRHPRRYGIALPVRGRRLWLAKPSRATCKAARLSKNT
jgi:hypothetical protein